MSTSLRGVVVAPGPQWWPQKSADEVLSYDYNMTDWLAAAGNSSGPDALASVSATIPWTASGDAQVTQLAVENTIITVQVTGGFPGKTYAVVIAGVTLFGNTFYATVLLGISEPFVEAGAPVPTLPVTAAATLTWVYSPSFDLTNPQNGGYIALLGGL